MKLPGAERAIVDIAKLRDYCLDPHHPRGRHKARVFGSALGLTQADAEILRDALLRVARGDSAATGNSDEYGDRYTIAFEMEHAGRHATIRSGSVVLRDEAQSRLTSCFVL